MNPSYLSSVSFSFYTPEEVRSMSVKEITSPIAFDTLGQPVPQGLYDPAMGISPYDSLSICATCGQERDHCPGHPGHIELPLPIFNPFLYPNMMYKIFKAKCWYCHKLRIEPHKLNYLCLKAKLVKNGKIVEAGNFETIFGGKPLDESEKKSSMVKANNKAKGRLHKSWANLALNTGQPEETSATIKARNEIVREFWGSVQRNCPHCDLPQMTIRKDGNSKIFRNPFTETVRAGLVLKQVENVPKSDAVIFVHPMQLRDELRELWRLQGLQMELLFNIKSSDIFFLDALAVPPNRFRPECKGPNDKTFLNVQTTQLTRIIQISNRLREMGNQDISSKSLIQTWVELQDTVNQYMDSSKAAKLSERETGGLRQILEKKEGLFRKNMMGKRVNQSARSVISPDPYIDSNEVGIPITFAKELTLQEFVTETNILRMQTLIKNGPHRYPGANIVEDRNGHHIDLTMQSDHDRNVIASTLLTGGHGKKVYRHVQNGDYLLVNRQPTLHKPSIMAHRARVLPMQNTIRLHYANCSSYNADFDGDEMNLHLPQSYNAIAEAKYLAFTDLQYTVPTSGRPLRGLIQDHVVSSVLLCKKDTFLTYGDYMQLLNTASLKQVVIVPPCILFPVRRWSGKQVITSILKSLAYGKTGINAVGKCKLSETVWGSAHRMEGAVVLRDNWMMTGVLDKGHIGATEFGLFHLFNEAYGPGKCSKLISSLARICTLYLQMHGFTCGMRDLILSPECDQQRRDRIEESLKAGILQVCKHVGLKKWKYKGKYDNRPFFEKGKGNGDRDPFARKAIGPNNPLTQKLLGLFASNPNFDEELDGVVSGTMNQSFSNILKECVPHGLVKRFPDNFFSLMVMSGAKGSEVNHAQISAMLGQQELEGRRVPRTSEGRNLPTFVPYDPHPRAGGFISDRFLSGLRPPEYFYHCMAGREGLIDTAVKTARSGYLQRCLVKNLEGLTVAYDQSVRDIDGSLVQFYYGEDGIDVTASKFVDAYKFLTENSAVVKERYNFDIVKKHIDMTSVGEYIAAGADPNDTVLNHFNPSRYFGAMSEKMYNSAAFYLQNNPDGTIRKKGNSKGKCTQNDFQKIISLKYQRSLAQPGEAVGVIAAESVGEPSTQMTLNTFHLAGHGGTNVTLGIPRLKEILTTTGREVKTPTMTIPFVNPDLKTAKKFAYKLERIKLADIVSEIKVTERSELKKQYTIKLKLQDITWIRQELEIEVKRIMSIIDNQVVASIASQMTKQLKKQIQIETKQTNTQGPSAAGSSKTNEDGYVKERLKNYDESDSEPEGATEVPITNKVEEKSAPIADYAARSTYLKNKNAVVITVAVPAESKKLLMMNIVETAIGKASVKSVRGINACHVFERKQSGLVDTVIQTEGINFKEIWKYGDMLDLSKLQSNDAYKMIGNYGIEAARNTIIREIKAVFGSYHITVDYRHLSLIADYMTFNGGYRPFNRTGIVEHPSSMLKASFETTMNFVIDAAINEKHEDAKSASACIILGRPAKIGTGAFDLLQDFSKQ